METPALVDTDASISCVAASVLTRLGIDRSKLQSMNATGAVAVGGVKHCSLGTLSLPVTFDNCIISHSFQVFEKFKHPVILGLDFLRENDAVLNVAENNLSLKDPITQNVLALEINTEINTGIARVHTPKVNHLCASEYFKPLQRLVYPIRTITCLARTGSCRCYMFNWHCQQWDALHADH